DVQDGIRFAIEPADARERKTRRGISRKVARAKTPAPDESELDAEMPEYTGGVIELIVHLEGVGVIGKPGRIFDVEDVVPEPLQAHDVMKVLPNHAGDGAAAHEAHHYYSLLFHQEGQV